MTKKLAIINDLSGFGRCSLTAAISVTSAMGVHACPLPTAILSAQTGFPSYTCYDFTEQMNEIRDEWKNKLEVHFDGIYTGFVSHENQLDVILDFVDNFKTQDTFLLVDPVLGDNGKTYDMFTESLQGKMTLLAKRADIITPNVTELCLLCGVSYSNLLSLSSEKLLKHIHEIGMKFCANGPKHILVTGISYHSPDGVPLIGNSYISADRENYSHMAIPYLGGSYSGTGDLFASCIAAGLTRGQDIIELMHLATQFLEKSIQNSVEENVPFIEGVNFEQYLYLLKI